MTTPGAPPTTPRHSPWLVLATLCFGFFMILLDTTIVNIAIPEMSSGLNASLDQILWVINAYILVYAVLLVTAGRLGDLYGPKRIFIVGLAIFTIASAACGLASDAEQMIFWRVVQGVGAALLTPQTLTVITMIFPAEKRGAAFGVWGAVVGVATIAGPTLGGYLVTDWGWEWIFFVNLPVGIITIALAVFVIPDIRLNRRPRLDWLGTVLVTTGLLLVTYGLIEGEPHDWGEVWGPITIWQVIGAGVVVLAIFMWHQYATRSGEPLIPFAIFADRNYSLMNLAIAAMSFAMFGLLFPLIIYLQSVLGLTALEAGVVVAPMSVVSIFVAPVVGRFADGVAGKWLLVAGSLIWGAGVVVVLSSAQVDSGQWSILPGLLVAGVGLGMTIAPVQSIAMRSIAPQMAGAASGFLNSTRQLGGVIGSAAVGAALQVLLASQLSEAARENAQALPEPLRERFIEDVTGAAGDNLQTAGGQSGVNVPADAPEQTRQLITDAAAQTFHDAYTAAMKSSLILPLVALGVAALACLFILQMRKPTGPVPAGPSADGSDPLPESESTPAPEPAKA